MQDKKYFKVEHWEKPSKRTLRWSPVTLVLEDRYEVQYRTEGSLGVDFWRGRKLHSCCIASCTPPGWENQVERVETFSASTVSPFQLSPTVKSTIESLKLLSYRLLEECYVMKDPFTPDKDKFLILGSHCSLCNRSVCVGTVSNKLLL